MAGVRQRVAAAMAQHVGVDQEVEAGTLAYALNQPIDGVCCERAAPLGRKDKATVGELPAKLSEGSDFIAPKWMDGGLAILRPPDMERCRSSEFDL
jgi:hypothetical protein